MTLWPEAQLPHPGWDRRCLRYELVDGAFITDWEWVTPARAPIPGEGYLELAAVDLDNPADMLDWVHRYGPPHLFDPNYDYADGFLALPGCRGVHEHLCELSAAAARRVTDGARQAPVSVEEFCWAAYAIADMTTAARIVCGDLDAGQATWRAANWQRPMHPWDRYEPVVPEDDGIVNVLALGLSGHLTPFSPRIGSDDRGPRLSDGYGPFPILCLELYNHIVARVRWRTCANETCGRLFVHHAGRAEHGQKRTRGVRYCMAACARAQASREYRRRQQGARTG